MTANRLSKRFAKNGLAPLTNPCLNPAVGVQALVACTEASEAMLRKEMAQSKDVANLKDGSY